MRGWLWSAVNGNQPVTLKSDSRSRIPGEFSVRSVEMCLAVAAAVFLLTMVASPVRGDEAVSPAAVLLGERMYREGLLPSGEPLQATINGDVAVSGTAFSCMSCHLRSGFGSTEGGVITTPVNGGSLFKPRAAAVPVMAGMAGGNGQTPPPPPPRRPAYTDATLATALREGIDPAGRTLNAVMPRYYLNDTDMALMVSYLKSLSADISPGIMNNTLHLATIITDDVPAEHVAAMIAPLDGFIATWNELAASFASRKNSKQSRLYAKSNRLASYQRLNLSRWFLKGPPSTWRSQLNAYYRAQPVFALVGGITTGDWAVIHEFSESKRLPCLLPHTDFPVRSASDWYTVYLSKGFYQEGEAAARFLANRVTPVQNRDVVQVMRDSRQGRALAAGFTDAWRGKERKAETFVLKEGETLSASPGLLKMIREHQTVLVIWDGPAVIAELQKLAVRKALPDLMLVSAGYLGNTIWSMPAELRDATHITYPYRLPDDEKMHDRLNQPLMKNRLQQDEDILLTAKKAAAVVGVLSQALFTMKDDLYRDYFLDIIGMIKDLDVPLYERFSFGPGQRYASKGCYVVTLSAGPKPTLVRKSDWVMH